MVHIRLSQTYHCVTAKWVIIVKHCTVSKITISVWQFVLSVFIEKGELIICHVNQTFATSYYLAKSKLYICPKIQNKKGVGAYYCVRRYENSHTLASYSCLVYKHHLRSRARNMAVVFVLVTIVCRQVDDSVHIIHTVYPTVMHRHCLTSDY